MLDSKYIDAATLDEDVFRDVLFLSLAEGGAMGVPGEIIVVNKTPAAYNMNFVFGDVKIDDVISLFPALGECHFGLFGLDSTVGSMRCHEA